MDAESVTLEKQGQKFDYAANIVKFVNLKSMDDDRREELDKQLSARQHFFRAEKLKLFEDKIKTLPHS